MFKPFEFIFLHGVRECSNFFFFFMWQSSFSAPFNEEIVSSPLYIFAFFVIEYIATGVCVCFWTLYPVPLVYISVFVLVAYCFE